MISNSIIDFIEKMEEAFKNLPDDKIKEMSKKLDVTFDEWCGFQDIKSRAQAFGRISYHEAVTIYEILGNSPEHFNKQTLVRKYVVTSIILELAKP